MHLLDVVQHVRRCKEAMKDDGEVVFVGRYATEADCTLGEIVSDILRCVINITDFLFLVAAQNREGHTT